MGRSADMPREHTVSTGDDAGCTVLHVDMDSFFASVEIRRNPDLRGRPVVVGGGRRGVVAAASYPARKYGVRSAMSMGQALRLCPTAVVIEPDHAAYAAVSRDVMAILRDVSPSVEPISLDEAFVDVAGAVRLLGPPAGIAASIRSRVAAELDLTCSVGVASTKFVAKLASARCKPDGLLVIPHADTLAFLHPLPITVLWGVGERTAEPLHRLGIRTVGDLAAAPLDAVRRAVGQASAEHLHALAHGRDPRPVLAREVEKSISADHTVEVDLTEHEDVRRELLRLSTEVAARVRNSGMVARTIGIKVRFADFRTVTRVRTLPTWTDDTAAVFAAAADLYDGLGLDRPRIRLVGVKCENLRTPDEAPEQLALDLTAQPQPASSTDRAVDAAVARYGAGAVRPAALLGLRERRPDLTRPA